jgi:hypothetical protein
LIFINSHKSIVLLRNLRIGALKSYNDLILQFVLTFLRLLPALAQIDIVKHGPLENRTFCPNKSKRLIKARVIRNVTQ